VVDRELLQLSATSKKKEMQGSDKHKTRIDFNFTSITTDIFGK
jgi:hypothetical protein